VIKQWHTLNYLTQIFIGVNKVPTFKRYQTMEIILGLVVIAVVGYLVFFRKPEEVVEVAPYKVETPETKVEVVNAQPVAEAIKQVAEKKAAAPAKKPAAKKAPAKKAPAKKPVAKATASKAPRAKKTKSV